MQAAPSAVLITASGGTWNILDPNPADVRLEDIVIGMARTCRFGGQFGWGSAFYSVAEHAMLMTIAGLDAGVLKTRNHALATLLHDASEGYLGDMPTPLKRQIPAYAALERRSQGAILAAFGLPQTSPPAIKDLDRRIVLDEWDHLIGSSAARPATTATVPLGVQPLCLSPQDAFGAFIDAFDFCQDLPRSPMATPPDWPTSLAPIVDAVLTRPTVTADAPSLAL